MEHDGISIIDNGKNYEVFWYVLQRIPEIVVCPNCPRSSAIGEYLTDQRVRSQQLRD